MASNPPRLRRGHRVGHCWVNLAINLINLGINFINFIKLG